MRIGATIELNADIDAAREGLTELADCGWMMGLPSRRHTHYGHPAGSALPRTSSRGSRGLVVATFGKRAGSAGCGAVLPIRWELVGLDGEFSVLLEGEISLSPTAAPDRSTLRLAGTCRLPARTPTTDDQDAKAQLVETVREFITSVAVSVAGPIDPYADPPEPAWF